MGGFKRETVKVTDAGWDLAADEAATPRMLSSLLKYAQAGTRPASGGHTDRYESNTNRK